MHSLANQPSSIREVPAATTPRAEDTFIRGYRQLALETPARRRDVLLRVLDVLLSALFLLLALALAVPIALIVLATSGRPVLYRWPRVGRGGRAFTMLECRTRRSAAASRRAGACSDNRCGVSYPAAADRCSPAPRRRGGRHMARAATGAGSEAPRRGRRRHPEVDRRSAGRCSLAARARRGGGACLGTLARRAAAVRCAAGRACAHRSGCQGDHGCTRPAPIRAPHAAPRPPP